MTLVLLYGGALLYGMPASVPFDIALNCGSCATVDALRAPNDGKVRLCVLQHGLWRTPWSLWKLERALRAHGYAVLNSGYPSTRGTVQQHSARLRDAIDAAVAKLGRVDEFDFVGHSLGGLVIADYLRRPDAVPARACVFLVAPMRGAALADLRKEWWWFRVVMGSGASLQLSPEDALHRLPFVLPRAVGTLVGSKGEGNPDIPGDDDGTVAVSEAHVPGELDSVTLPLGHTLITVDDRSIREVLAFLHDERFVQP